MIDLYYWTTPNGHKITIFLEEARVPYEHVRCSSTTPRNSLRLLLGALSRKCV